MKRLCNNVLPVRFGMAAGRQPLPTGAVKKPYNAFNDLMKINYCDYDAKRTKTDMMITMVLGNRMNEQKKNTQVKRGKSTRE